MNNFINDNILTSCKRRIRRSSGRGRWAGRSNVRIYAELKIMANCELLILFLVLLVLVYRLNIEVVKEYASIYHQRREMMCQLAVLGQYRQRRVARKPARPRRFWVRPGRTTAWWDNFVAGVVVNEEWKENFRMCKNNFLNLCSELRPYIQPEETVMRAPIDVERQVAMTLLSIR